MVAWGLRGMTAKNGGAFKYMLLDFSFSDIVKLLEFFHSEMLYKLG